MEKIEPKSDIRIDIEIYVMGEMKLEFISFLSDCFKSNFTETLSWGNFRRFQLLIQNKRNWINVYFIVVNNEQNGDLLINSFKMYEKRNFMLMIYNANDQKSEKHIDSLYNIFLGERNKLYEGILNDDTITKNLERISNCNKQKLSHEEIKGQLKFLSDNKTNLIYKIGFLPNLVNKKTKNVKKNDNPSSTLYEISQEIFFIPQDEDEIKTNFQGLMSFILKEHFNTLRIELDNNSLINIVFNNSGNNTSKTSSKQKNDDLLYYTIKGIDWLIIFYIAISCYKFMF